MNDTQDLQRRALGVADVARATAARAGDGRALVEGGTQALAAHFEQAKLADGTELHTRAVLAQRVAQAVFHLAPVARLFHVDEVDHDQTAQVAQAGLTCHFVGGFEVGAGGGFFDVTTFDGARRVHVHRHQGFGLVDHDGAAAGQVDRAAVGGLDLVLDLEAREQRSVVAVAFDAVGVFGHHVRDEALGLFVNVVGVDQDLTDVVVEIVADGSDHQGGFLVNQESALAGLGCTVDRRPQLEQVIQVPLQLGGIAADAGGAGDDAHAIGVFKLVKSRLEFGAVVALDAPAHTAATWVVGHQHHIAAGQADKSGQCRALVAALFFFDLHQ